LGISERREAAQDDKRCDVLDFVRRRAGQLGRLRDHRHRERKHDGGPKGETKNREAAL
jgi:hypothetical protein